MRRGARRVALVFPGVAAAQAQLVTSGPSWGGLTFRQWLTLAAVLAGATLLALAVQRLVLSAASRVSKLKPMGALRGPLSIPAWALLVALGLRLVDLPPVVHGVFGEAVKSLLIIAVVWLSLRALKVFDRLVEQKVAGDKTDPWARSVRTQASMLRRLLEVAIWVLGVALLLMQFEVVRNVGVSVLASAGIAGLVIGLAAQKSISSLLAGIQLSISQPIRLGDSVVVEGQSGTIEEIRLTYVVVRVWDLRRLVLPITYFLEKPFENWSRGTPEMLGAVTVQVNLLAEVEAFRTELRRVLEGEGKAWWDGRTASLVVTEALEGSLTLRALVGTSTAGSLWDLRCLVRERLVQLLQAHPEWLPSQRTEARATSRTT